jgi:Tfp pilus assembly protein PilF
MHPNHPTSLLILAACLLAACSSIRGPEESSPAHQPLPPAGTTQQPGQPQPVAPPPTATEPPPRPAPKQFHLGPAATALVAQAHKQASSGNYPVAAATIERALRIEPENPLLWIELGQVQLNEGNGAQADGMGRKALALATGDPQAQASSWRLIAESLRARGRNQEAAEADRKAGAVAAR